MSLSRFARFTVALCTVSLSPLFVPATFAQSFTFSLDPAIKPGSAGASVTFQGTLNNNTSSPVFVNQLAFFFDPDLDVTSASPAFATPFSIAANSSYTGNVFTVQISSSASGNTISGDVTPFGGATDSDTTPLLLDPVTFLIAPVIIPETNTLGLLAFAAPVAGFLAYRRRFRKA